MASIEMFKLSASERREAAEKLIEQSSPQRSFFLMIGLSVILATLGLLTGQIVIVIGAMLVAPLLSPILSVGLGVVLADFKLIRRSLWVILKSFIVAMVLSLLVSIFLFIPLKENNQLLEFISPHIVYFYISIVAGVAAAFAMARPNLSETLPGIAVAVTLIPPLSSIGIGIAKFQGRVVIESVGIFFINLIGLVLASVFIFSLMGFSREKGAVTNAIKKEERIFNNHKAKDDEKKS